MDNKQRIKEFLKQSLGIEGEEELEKFSTELLAKVEIYENIPSTSRRTSKVWKKEEIEELGIEVTPVDWKKLK
tara:strand:- start:281 stop:499 length:219 start_codon:yes stop_codon:yes gene_type:complete